MKLPSGTNIRLISAPAFLATKFEAFLNRGKGDLIASHDLENILNVVDGRPELLAEVQIAPAGLRRHLVEQCLTLLSTRNFRDYLPGMLNDNDSPPARADTVYERLNALAQLTT